jgi:sugar lactone lactonase YvrE
MSPAVECVVACGDQLGESPIWDEREQLLWWVDVKAPAIRCRAGGAATSFPLPQPVGSIALRVRGGLLAALKSGTFLWDPHTLTPFAAPASPDPSLRFNDGRCDRAGRFWAGTMDDATQAPKGQLYRVSPDARCESKRSAIAIPNSLCWSPDGRTMYFADSARRTIWAFDYDAAAGEMTNERVFATTPLGFPDGSCIDADGCLWNAEYGSARVVRYTPKGKVDRVIAMPVKQPTCCCFGGKSLDTLYITSAAQQLTPAQLAEQPLAGGLFAVKPGSTGLPEARFAG